METTFELSADDLAWISARIKANHRAILNSEKLSQSDKNSAISSLAKRAHKFKMLDVVHLLGWTVLTVPGNDQISLLLPRNCTKQDYETIIRHLELIKTEDKQP